VFRAALRRDSATTPVFGVVIPAGDPTLRVSAKVVAELGRK